MAEVDTPPRFGAELKDAFKPVNNWVSNGIAWLEDQQQFYRERAAIEKDYSTRLSALAKKYYEKKAKRSSGLSVGDTPTLTPGSLERYSCAPVCPCLGLLSPAQQRFPHDMDISALCP